MSWANLQGASLIGAKLQGADLKGTYLRDVSLDRADLQGAILPDGKTHTISTDMGTFTNRENPDFSATLEEINKIRFMTGLKLREWK